MLLDHLYYFPVPLGDYAVFLKIAGRLAFPLYLWGIYQGVLRTRDLDDYRFRLLLLAGVSEYPFWLYFGEHINIIWVLLFATFVFSALKSGEFGNLTSFLIFSLFMQYYDITFFYGYCFCLIFHYAGGMIFRFLLMIPVCAVWGILQIPMALSVFFMREPFLKLSVNRNIYRCIYPGHLLIYSFLRAVS